MSASENAVWSEWIYCHDCGVCGVESQHPGHRTNTVVAEQARREKAKMYRVSCGSFVEVGHE